ncbi:MAG: helix-turn-helix transcriptional regulator [Treponema sp.]|nr:helix-turn-helix transcriptional regulator [Treponema sp.]
MSDFKDDFIENLIFYRTQKGLSQLELSGICDCAKSTIGGIESRKNFPSFELILKIAYALEIHPADLFLRNASQSLLFLFLVCNRNKSRYIVLKVF